MKNILLFSLAFAVFQTSCGPAAENRETMHSRAKQIGDSIANSIKTSMAEAEAPAVNTAVKVDSAAATTTTPVK